MSDEELAELEAKFDRYVVSAKKRKELGYPSPKMSIPDSILEEEKNEVKPYAGDDEEEVEPNDSMENADRTYIDDYMYGTIENRDDVDYFKIKFSVSGKGYFRLSVPDDVDYELYVMSSTGNDIEEGTDGVEGETERLYAFVTPDMYYYMRVEGAGKYDYDEDNQYFVRVKLYDDEEEYATCVGAEYDGIGEDEINTADDAINAYNVFDDIGYTSEFCIVPSYDYLDGTNPDGTDRLGSSIVFLDGHGEYNRIRFESPGLQGTNDEEYNTGVSTKDEELEDSSGSIFVPIKYKDVSNSRLMIFAACYTAEEVDGESNLTEYAVRRGAETAIGWEDEIGEQYCTDWMERFLDKLEEGYTVEDAAMYADEDFQSSNNIVDWIIEGNEDNVINLSGPYSLNSPRTLKDISDLRDISPNIELYSGNNDLDIDALNDLLRANYSYFVPEDYKITIKPVNDYTYRVYYEKYINDFNTNSGFYAVIKNGELYFLKEKFLEYDEKELSSRAVELNEDIVDRAKELASNCIPDEYYITEQTIDKSIIDGEYCIVVNTTYAVDYGTDAEAFSCKNYIYKL